MATEVFATSDITLLDGTEVEVRPLPISKLRKVMRTWSDHMKLMQATFIDRPEDAPEVDEADITDKQFDVYVKMCAIALEAQLKDERTDKQFKDYLEDTLDEKSIYKILEVSAGLKLGNQEPVEMPVA